MTKKLKSRTRWLFRILLLAVVAICLFILVLSISLPRVPDDLNDIALSTPTVIYSETGQIVSVLADREVIPFSQLPQHLRQAVLAMEDARFYNHHGISKRGLLRALWVDLIHLSLREGGSSITQQLAKNLFFSFDKSWSRKLKEMLIACQLEQQFSKDEILHAYCNQIPFGSNIYGVELAAQTYFGKHAQDLSLAESAMLAGIPRWPPRYNPYYSFEIAKKRQSLVLHRMRQVGFIDRDQEEQAREDSLVIGHMNPMSGRADYFVEEIKKFAEQKYGSDALNYGGLKITTTMDTRLQRAAVESVRDGLAELDKLMGFAPFDSASFTEKRQYPQAALVAIDPRNGKVKAMVGGREYRSSQYNRATANNRHAGSSFKPFLYLAALDLHKVTPTTVLVDELVTYEVAGKKWTPENFEKTYQGPMVLKYALMHSKNAISAKLIFRTSPDAVVDYARRLGITSPLEAHSSLALGAAGVSPLEMAGAFGCLANGGVLWTPISLIRVEAFDGKVLDTFQNSGKRVINHQTVYLLVDMMRGVVEAGTGKSVRQLGFKRPCAGKTGTSSDYKDSWFIGYTPELVTAVWVGFDESKSMYDRWRVGITGARGALPIWTTFMKRALSDQPVRDFVIPPGIEFREVDPVTGGGAMPAGASLEVAVRSEM